LTSHCGDTAIPFFARLLFSAYLIEAGFLLILAPWTALWDRNYFAALYPWLFTCMSNHFVRGAVTGVGLVTGWVGVRDLSRAFISRWSDPT